MCVFAHLGCQVCESVCVCVRERESVCSPGLSGVCVCKRERECVCLRTWAVRCVRVYVCVRERERVFAHLGCQVSVCRVSVSGAETASQFRVTSLRVDFGSCGDVFQLQRVSCKLSFSLCCVCFSFLLSQLIVRKQTLFVLFDLVTLVLQK